MFSAWYPTINPSFYFCLRNLVSVCVVHRSRWIDRCSQNIMSRFISNLSLRFSMTPCRIVLHSVTWYVLLINDGSTPPSGGTHDICVWVGIIGHVCPIILDTLQPKKRDVTRRDGSKFVTCPLWLINPQLICFTKHCGWARQHILLSREIEARIVCMQARQPQCFRWKIS